MTKKCSLSKVELANVPFKEVSVLARQTNVGGLVYIGIELFQNFKGLGYILLVIRLDLGPFAESTA